MPTQSPAKRRTWTPPAPPPPDRATASPASQSAWKSAGDYASQLLGCIIVFGFIGILFWSWFPLALGLFFFFTNDRFIEWALGAVGIRLVPDTIGSQAVKSFVFLASLGALCTGWKDSVPALLSPWVPIGASWLQIGVAAVVIAALTLASTWVTRRVLPRIGIEHSTGTVTLAVEGLLVLAFLGAVFSASVIFG
jgi:hypothetical protein